MTLSRRKFIATSSAASAAVSTSSFAAEAPLFSVGLIADAQYVDADRAGARYYRNSVKKLGDAVKTLNDSDIEFSIHLGDLIDREFSSFDDILEPLADLKTPIHQILGNHDFDVTEDKKPEVPAKMGMKERYYAFSKHGLRFIFLDGTEISTFSQPKESATVEQASEMLKQFKAEGRKSAKGYNAAIGKTQLAWLETQLKEAATAGERAIISCHYPILPDNPHNLWNDQEVLSLIDQHSKTVIAWFNGHNHAGNYAERNGVHYVTVEGMVNTPDTNAFAVMDVMKSSLKIHGHGRVTDRILNF